MTKNAIDEAGLRKGDIVLVEYTTEPPGLFIMVDGVNAISTRVLGDAGNLCDVTVWCSAFWPENFRGVVGHVSASIDVAIEEALLHIYESITAFFYTLPAHDLEVGSMQKARAWWAKCYGEQQA